jgi:hypothetical protein
MLGSGIGIRFSSPLIKLNTITGNGNNICSGEGGGISIGGLLLQRSVTT